VSISELAVNGISAAGAVGAAVAALWIATRDRHERRSERHAADRAQARLVLIEARSSQQSIYYHLDVHNHGTQPILDVSLDTAILKGHPARWKPREGSDSVIRVIRPETDEALRSFVGEFINDDGTPITDYTSDADGNRRYPNKPDTNLISATINFTDANGNIWRLTSEGQLTHTGTAA
jgi:hypothetical protein